MQLNLFDILVAVLALLVGFRGWRRGFLIQASELGGGFVGLVAGVALGPRVASRLTDEPGLQAALISLVVVFAALSLGQGLGFALGHKFGSFARRAHLGAVDSSLGALFGIVITLISYWLIGSLLIQGPSQAVAAELRDSKLLKRMIRVASPPDILATLGHYLDTSGFPQVFTGVPPLGRPVKLPSGKQTRRAYQAADQSTVRVVVSACGGLQLGSGWVAANSTVVTNAHVVAGAERVTVQTRSGQHSSRVVLFDDDLDLAVLRVPGLGAPALSLTTRTFGPGRKGATLGYPGSKRGRLSHSKAAIQTRVQAQGRDIYGQSYVKRDIYQLRANVQQGDSGGPFVLPNGRVAGVVFAASVASPGTGYALTGKQVAPNVAKGSRSTKRVSTGPCTH